MIRGLVGRKTNIDLRNENTITGVIENVDYLMNIDLSQVTFQNIYGEKSQFDKFYVRGCNVRYVHIPVDVNILETIQSEIKKSERILNFVPEKTHKPKLFKNKDNREKMKKKADEKVAETRKKLGIK